MVREIINLLVGHCGNQIGFKFWEMITRSHKLFPDGSFFGTSENYLEKIDVYFNENEQGKFIPRSILVDLDKELINEVSSSSILSLIDKKNIICGDSNIRNNWAAGFYHFGPEIIEKVIDSVRKETEICDSLQGFQLVHSLGGGTGSGLGTLILKELRDEYPDVELSTFSVLPSQKVSDTLCDSINTVLALDQLIELADQIFYFDNESLFNLAFKTLRLSTPTFGDLNYCVACDMTGATYSLRFPDLLNSNLRKISNNLIPFSRFKFLKSTFAPPTSRGAMHCSTYSADRLANFWFYGKNYTYLAAYALFHGRFIKQKVLDEMRRINSGIYNINVDINYSIFDETVENIWRSATLIENSTNCKSILQNQRSSFMKLYKRRSFAHKYIDEGLDGFELEMANSNLEELINEYEAFFK